MKNLKKILLLGVIYITFFSYCSLLQKDTKNSKDAATVALALALQPPTCNLGGETFIISEGNISCNGVSAEGTGLLLSTKDKDKVSLLLDFTLNGSDSLVVLYAASDGNLRLTGSGFRFGYNSAQAFHFDSSTPQNMTGFATTSNKKVCLEIHTDEVPPHLIAKGDVCTDGEESEFNPGGSQARKGTKWGFELKNAKINSLNINSSIIFAH